MRNLNFNRRNFNGTTFLDSKKGKEIFENGQIDGIVLLSNTILDGCFRFNLLHNKKECFTEINR